MLEIWAGVTTKGAMNCNLSGSQLARFVRFLCALPVEEGFLAFV
jgi:hypothetical protein